jgi:hypothetical protein
MEAAAALARFKPWAAERLEEAAAKLAAHLDG